MLNEICIEEENDEITYRRKTHLHWNKNPSSTGTLRI
jgi:hypothetical protein